MGEDESVETMRGVLATIREEMRELRREDDAETPDAMPDAAASDGTLSVEEDETDDGEGDRKVGTSVGSRAVSLTDLASLARSNEAAPPESIWEAARNEKQSEAERAEPPTDEDPDQDPAPPEPLRGTNATWDALDRLTSAVTQKLESEDEGDTEH